MSSLLVATDFSPAADLALTQAIELARALDVGVELLHVHAIQSTPMPPTLDVARIPPSAKDVSRAEVMMLDRADRVRAAGVPCQTESRFGSAADEIVKRAEEIRPVFVVLGTHGHSAFMHALLGGVSEKVLRGARCPVLLVPWSQSQART
ncbi:MAG TPA: universal stress protein [Polyangia bacterium]